jgi:hypothetical protein
LICYKLNKVNYMSSVYDCRIFLLWNTVHERSHISFNVNRMILKYSPVFVTITKKMEI